MSDGFDYWYRAALDALDHGNPRYGAAIMESLEDELITLGIEGLPEVDDGSA